MSRNLGVQRRVSCPACGCDVTREVRDAYAMRVGKRLNKSYVLRVAKLLVAAENYLCEDPRRQMAGTLWKADFQAVRYVFNALMATRDTTKARTER